MYRRFTKRFLDFILSLTALILLSPVIIILIVLGAVMMGGNPFFVQKRPGRNEKIFSLIKFRTMSMKKGADGRLLSDDERLTRYGKLLRSTSLDELPELFNILAGQMALVGPRPLLCEYLDFYTEEEHHRHDVRPGLTGLAQINGRNAIDSWEQRFAYDLTYVGNYSLSMDIKILVGTVSKVIKRSGIQVGSAIKVGRLDDARRNMVNGVDSEVPS